MSNGFYHHNIITTIFILLFARKPVTNTYSVISKGGLRIWKISKIGCATFTKDVERIYNTIAL